uniref:Uncharacterized protein n=1 Tax=Anguilla anguilla TaxID=7936 RepID=A0A0E9W0I0_ANGAN
MLGIDVCLCAVEWLWMCVYVLLNGYGCVSVCC